MSNFPIQNYSNPSSTNLQPFKSSQINQHAFNNIRSTSNEKDRERYSPSKSSYISEYNRGSFKEKGFHKRQLGQDLDVTCFLLAVEVERLYEECHYWRSRVETYESSQLDRRAYDSHISELTEKLNLAEQNTQNFQFDNENLRKQIQDWGQRYVFLQNDKDKEIETLKQTLRKIAEDLHEQLKLKDQVRLQEDRITSLNLELERWQRATQERGIQISELKSAKEQLESRLINFENEIQRLTNLLTRKEKEQGDLLKTLQSYEDIINKQKHFEIELRDLKLILEAKQREVEEWKARHQDLLRVYEQQKILEQKLHDSDNKILILSSEIEKLQRQLKQKQDDTDSYRQKITQMEISIVHFMQFEQKAQEYESKLHLTTTEIERLNAILNSRQQDNDLLHNKLRQLNEENRNHVEKHKENELSINTLQIRLDELSDHINRREGTIESYRQQCDRLEQTVRSQEQKIHGYESKILQLSQELERLSKILDIRNTEITEQKQKYSQLEGLVLNLRGVEEKNRENEIRIQSLLSTVEENKQRNQQLEQYVYSLRGYQQKSQEQETQITILHSDIDKLNNLVKLKIQEVDEWRSRNNNLEIQLTKMKAYESKLVDYENRINYVMSENDRLQLSLRQKQNDFDDLKQKYNSIELGYQSSELRGKDLEKKLILVSQDLEKLASIIKQKENEIQEFQSQYYRLSDKLTETAQELAKYQRERETLNGIIREKAEDVESWKQKFAKLQIRLQDYNKMEETIHVLNAEIDRLTSELNQHKNDNQMLRQYFIDKTHLEQKNLELLTNSVLQFAEIQSVRQRLQEKERECDEIRRNSLAPYRKLNY